MEMQRRGYLFVKFFIRKCIKKVLLNKVTSFSLLKRHLHVCSVVVTAVKWFCFSSKIVYITSTTFLIANPKTAVSAQKKLANCGVKRAPSLEVVAELVHFGR